MLTESLQSTVNCKQSVGIKNDFIKILNNLIWCFQAEIFFVEEVFVHRYLWTGPYVAPSFFFFFFFF